MSKNELVFLGKDILRGKKYFGIKRNERTVKSSQFPLKLLDWFTKEYPTEILQIKIERSDLK